MKKRLGWLSIALGVLFIALLLVFLYRMTHDPNRSDSTSFERFVPQQLLVPPIAKGSLTRISAELQLFRLEEFDSLNQSTPSASYYSAGEFTKGSYTGFERIIAMKEPMGPGGPMIYILATKDRKSFLLHESDNASKLYPETDWRNPFQVLDKKKISSVVELPFEHPRSIVLNSKISLFQTTIVTDNVKSGKRSKEGYEVYENVIQTDFSSYEPLTVKGSPLTFFGLVSPPVNIPPEWEEDARVQAQLRAKYIKGSTSVIVIDSSGLPFAYTLTRSSEISNYLDVFESYNKTAKEYEKQRIRFENKETTELPEYPIAPNFPNLRFTGDQVKAGGERFASYDVAVPYICGVDVDIPTIQNIADDELLLFGTVFGQDVYTLKNLEHPFYKLAYRNKMLMSKEEFEVINSGMQKLTFEEYVAKHPVLFFKDFWDRWVAVGEYEYKMIGGCGKPVLYLYPPEPMDVSVTFTKPMEITYSVPDYQSGWFVRAEPDGSIHDLLPEQTDCDSFDVTRPGSEYARSACEANVYPYIYWAGNRLGMSYPSNPYVGWVVSQDRVVSFLDTTLTTIGFTKREKTDFLAYWAPMLLSKNAPWYHIRFLQTNDMNRFVPMQIHPIPDRYYRFFLDWKPLSAIPNYTVSPQQLERIDRRGFTIVEWGGLRQ